VTEFVYTVKLRQWRASESCYSSGRVYTANKHLSRRYIHCTLYTPSTPHRAFVCMAVRAEFFN